MRRILIGLLFAVAANAAAAGVNKETIESGGRKHVCYVYAPAKLAADAPVPLLMLFHGSGRDGMSQINEWRTLADHEGFILAAPDALDTRQWTIPDDGPDLLRDILAFVAKQHKIDLRRVYGFGHSAGAGFMLNMAPIESNLFAAIAMHAGAFKDAATSGMLELARRKIPIFIVIGTKDQFFPVEDVRKTREGFAGAGFPIETREIPNHDHNYYRSSREINGMAWAFLSPKHLDADAHYTAYRIVKNGDMVSMEPVEP
jgi:Poly(3-hydroxybutyrate) depolymerase